MRTDEKNYYYSSTDEKRRKKTNKQFHSLAHIHENHFGMLREKIIFCRIAKKVYINNKKKLKSFGHANYTN